ncbi:ABC transporter substrate-binding protein [Campylobacter sp. FMV-PI01]|uniref:ABC transporter substrate-binding protein n=1 Tax=Campylobacter portucalensis TaxID=2608384 RepID=A0A6L5WKS6_9BACT|nr:ABC transporter substrate-binding protein [Campylobacter portucalensis]MSN96857.1 ABC transporter substrate-binding protein [Campylobacter portucalensis]
MRKFLILFLVNFCFAKGVIVLDPACVEIFYMLNAEDKIAAIAKTQSSEIWPQEKIKFLPSVGTYVKPNLEKIIEIQPDMVLTGFHSKEIIDDLERFGIKYIEIKSNKLSDIYKNIQTIANLTNKKNEGQKLIDDLKNRLNSLDLSKVQGKKAVFFYMGTNLMALGKDTLVGDIFEFMKIDNVAKNLSGKTPIVTSEYLLEQDLDYILFVGNSLEDLLKQNPVLRHTKAYKNGKILNIKSSSLLRGTPRIIYEIETLYKDFIK